MAEKKGKKKLLLIGGAVVLLIISAAAFAALTGGIAVKTAQADIGLVEKTICENALVDAYNTVLISSMANGQIETVSVSEGQTVAKGDRLLSYKAGSASLDLQGLKAQLAAAQIQAKQARELAAKSQTLYEQGVISYEEYRGNQVAAEGLTAQASALNYSVQSAKTAASLDGLNAPASGVITLVKARAGETVVAGTPLFEISDLASVYIKAELVTDDADLTAKGQKVRLFTTSGELLDDKAAVAKVHLKAQDVLSDLGVYQKRVTVEISPSVNSLRLGSELEAEIIVAVQNQVLRIPTKALIETDGQDALFTVTGSKAHLCFVTIGLKGDDFCQISEGLNEGDTVILSPPAGLKEGSKVK